MHVGLWYKIASAPEVFGCKCCRFGGETFYIVRLFTISRCVYARRVMVSVPAPGGWAIIGHYVIATVPGQPGRLALIGRPWRALRQAGLVMQPPR